MKAEDFGSAIYGMLLQMKKKDTTFK